jgi:hypothetical protein
MVLHRPVELAGIIGKWVFGRVETMWFRQAEETAISPGKQDV